MVTLMIGAATQNARKKGKAIKGITWKIAVTLVFVEVLTQSILLGFQIVPPTAQYIISISGMVIGNSMVLSILFLNRFTAEIETHRDETELILSLGGTPKQAIHRQLINAIKASMIPTIESQKTMGLVQLTRYDEWSNHRRCGPHPSGPVPIAHHFPIINDSCSDKCIAWLFIVSQSIQSTDAATER